MEEPRVESGSQHITIRIRGHLPDRYFEGFEGMRVTKLANGETMISGEVGDQAQLFGLLIRIRDLGIPLLEINCCTSTFTKEEIENDYKDRK
ncbi:MAG: hypothetical protein JJE12_13830 [Anaerolineales bacterium]|nr:hypothetical protein [Anaerolineales bacterium]